MPSPRRALWSRDVAVALEDGDEHDPLDDGVDELLAAVNDP